MSAEKVLDLAELADLAKPIRTELVRTRTEIVRLLAALRTAASTGGGYQEALARLNAARARRDAYKRLLLAIQAVLDAEAPAVDYIGRAVQAFDNEATRRALEVLR